MGVLKYFLGGTTVASLAGTGWAYSYKQSIISQRRQELINQKQHIESRINEETRAFEATESARLEAVSRAQGTHAAFATLWDDRMNRYHQANEDAKSYLNALPEALGAVKGLTNHYRYVNEELRHFVGFDIASSKVNNLSLLLHGAGENGVVRVASALRGLFSAEPLIHEVCNSLVSISEGQKPTKSLTTISDLSQTYLFCMKELDRSVEEASNRFVRENRVNIKQSTNMVLQGVEEVLDKMKLKSRPASTRDASEVEEELKCKRRLIGIADVQEAIKFTDQVLSRLSTPAVEQPDQFVQHHPVVKAAAHQLRCWQEGATAYLVESQSFSALHSYQKLLALSLIEENLSRQD